MPRFTLYGREECHLCDAMHNELRELQRNYTFDIEWIDVDSDPALELKYGFYVPVLMLNEQKICHYHLDENIFKGFLKT